MKKIILSTLVLGTLFAVFVLPDLSYAITSGQVPNISMETGNVSIKDILVNIINFVLGFAAAIAVLFIIIGGVMYMTSGGNEDRLKKSKSLILQAVIGLVIVILALVIVNLTTSIVKNNVIK